MMSTKLRSLRREAACRSACGDRLSAPRNWRAKRVVPAPGSAAAALYATFFVLTISAGAAEDSASSWSGDDHGAIRLVAGSRPALPDLPLRAGAELRLRPGWHTYWRYPGDAGVPPHFDFTGSDNLKTVDVRFPAPKRMTEDGLTVIGYTGQLILPLVVVPQNPGAPVKLHMKLDYAVCEKQCVPAQGEAELLLGSSQSTTQDVALAAAEARVPKQVGLGKGDALVIRSMRRAAGAAQGRVLVEVAAPAGADVSLFAEGPGPDWAFPVPAEVPDAPAGLRLFSFDLDGAPPGASYEGVAITLTAVSGAHAIEVRSRLD
ncbi:MAG: protein-disulfide reductase DsbD domain-containing protein [Xanthobacteraceae bacterium]